MFLRCGRSAPVRPTLPVEACVPSSGLRAEIAASGGLPAPQRMLLWPPLLGLEPWADRVEAEQLAELKRLAARCKKVEDGARLRGDLLTRYEAALKESQSANASYRELVAQLQLPP